MPGTDLREGRALATVALTSLTLFALLAGWARYASPAPWEPDLVVALALGDDPWADLVRGLNWLGNLPVWVVLVAIGSVVVYLSRGLAAAVLVGMSVAADLVGALVKVVVERVRPDGAIIDSLFGADSYAFPSGHVLRAVTLAAALAWVMLPVGRRLPVALAAAVLAGLAMGYARVALGVHWPTDALGGLLLGLGWFGLTTRGMQMKPASASRG